MEIKASGRRGGKKSALNELEELMRAEGNVPCPYCSTANFTIWHKPGQHCKNQQETIERVFEKGVELDKGL
jgi:hypothetical protein